MINFDLPKELKKRYEKNNKKYAIKKELQSPSFRLTAYTSICPYLN